MASASVFEPSDDIKKKKAPLFTAINKPPLNKGYLISEIKFKEIKACQPWILVTYIGREHQDTQGSGPNFYVRAWLREH